ncbi:MAG TPA: NAD-dependent epimerase/dehydratase family protein [Solirubrobacteraceae bacterium]|nr:NAD-dependent epimerase/dehydratase family protein [Solirubrobacteraceae bacterium]
MTRIAVTGGSGKAGRAVVQDLVERGHEVLNIDQAPSPQSSSPESPIRFLRADVTDFGQPLEALSGSETLPAIEAIWRRSRDRPTPRPIRCYARTSPARTRRSRRRRRLGPRRVVSASSETTLGLPFARPPGYAPVDESHVYP